MNTDKDIIFKDILVIVHKKENADFSYSSNERAGAGYIIILSGEGVFRCGEYEKHLKKNDVIFIDRYDKYSIDACKDGLEYLTSAFLLGEGQTFRAYGVPYCVSMPSVFTTAQTLLSTWEKRDRGYTLTIRKILYEVLVDALCMAENAKNPQSVSKIAPAVEYINKHFKEEINYTSLASLCAFSASHFRKIFVQEMQMPPTVYREKVRCEVAKGMLISDIFTITEIADELGYCDIFHFSKEFKKQTGFSPSVYKKQYFKS